MNLKTNPELFPLIEWWEKDGKQTVIWLLVAVLAVGGWYWWKGHRASSRAAAADAVMNAFTTEELEDAVAKFSGSDAIGALRIRLAKKYFDDGRYQEALDQYDTLVGIAPDGFQDIAHVGRAQCLEALGKYDEAQKAFDAFAETGTNSYLKLTAQLGAARTFVEAGDRKTALARIAAIKAANAGDELATARIEAAEDFVKRYEKKAVPPAAPVATPAAPAPAAAKPAPVAATPAPAAKPAPAETPAAKK